MTFFLGKISIFAAKISVDILFLVIDQIFQIFPCFSQIFPIFAMLNVIFDPFLTRKTPFFTILILSRASDNTNSLNIAGDQCMGRPPPQILGGPSPQSPPRSPPLPLLQILCCFAYKLFYIDVIAPIIILTPLLVKSPSSFHLVSASPITSKFALVISLMTLVSFPGLSMVRTFHVPTWILFFRSFFFFWFLLIWKGFRWMMTEEAPLPPLPDATLPGIQIESFTSLAFFFNGFIKHILGIYREVVSQVLPLSVFHETPSLALTSSVIRPSESSPLGLAYTGEDSVVHHDIHSIDILN